ncbi:hypothetical protein D3C83_196000 [compost metagenome]
MPYTVLAPGVAMLPAKVVSRPSPVVEPWSLRLCGPSPDITVTTLSVGAKPRCTR